MIDGKAYLSTDDLIKAKEISFRTGNCCKDAGLNSLYDILSYYEQGDSFKNIKGVGVKTCLELQWLCETFKPLSIPNCTYSEPEKEMMYDADAEMIEQLNALFLIDVKRKTIEEKYNRIIQTCSVSVRVWLEKIPLTTLVTEYLTYSDNKSPEVKYFLMKNLREAIEIKKKIQTEIKRQLYMSKEGDMKEDIFNRYGLTDNEYPVSYYLKYGHFPMFWILEKQLENDNSRDIDALKKTFKIYQNQKPLSLTEFAAEYSISRERVRQIRKQLYEDLFRRDSAFFQNRNDWQFYKPWSKDAIWQEDMQSYINEEQCNLSNEFVLQILLSLLYYDDYTLYGGIDSKIQKNSWHNAFLVKNNFAEIFDFDKFRADFKVMQLTSRTEYLMDVRSYVAHCKCWKKRVPNTINNIAGIAKDILRYEFQVCPEPNGRIKITALKKKTLSDIMYGILKDNGNPMHLSEIFAEFKKLKPEHHYSDPTQLRPNLLKHESISYRNRNSIYVLKEWTHVKFGTIRSCIIELLTKKRSPQSAKDILDYVLQYFPETNNASVRTSMFNDTQRRFVFFNNELFGLSHKKYHSKYKRTNNSLMPFSQRLSDLEKFIAENGHFPFASSKNRNERILGVWWVRVNHSSYPINEKQRNELKRVKNQYAKFDTTKRMFQWNINYDTIKSFILESHRMPYVSTEKFLYHWYGRFRTDFLENRLNENQRQKYIELVDLINESVYV
jgi:hypothetical protein